MMLQAVAHDVKNKLAELAMRLMDFDVEAAALALDAAEKLSHALLFDNPDQLVARIEAHCPIELAEEMIAVYAQLFPDKTVHIDISNAPNIWFYDIELMRLAISNAMHNACKHGQREIKLSVFVDNDYLVFEIRNDGPLFPVAMLNSNWQATTPQEHSSRTHQSISTGLGLLLTHKIVSAHINDTKGLSRYGHLILRNDAEAVARLAIP
jgi:signal transduction histidine kinase